MVVLIGLQLVEELGCEEIWIKSDAEGVVKQFHSLSFSLFPYGVVFAEAYALMCRLRIVDLGYALKGCNKVTHVLTTPAL